jgi:hypothetical protein
MVVMILLFFVVVVVVICIVFVHQIVNSLLTLQEVVHVVVVDGMEVVRD